MQGSYCGPVVGDEGGRFRKDLRPSGPAEDDVFPGAPILVLGYREQPIDLDALQRNLLKKRNKE
jgi:hypothetical protein